jgi:uncharacterized protein YbcI
MAVINLMATLTQVEREHQRQASRDGDLMGLHQLRIEEVQQQRAMLSAILERPVRRIAA